MNNNVDFTITHNLPDQEIELSSTKKGVVIGSHSHIESSDKPAVVIGDHIRVKFDLLMSVLKNDNILIDANPAFTLVVGKTLFGKPNQLHKYLSCLTRHTLGETASNNKE